MAVRGGESNPTVRKSNRNWESPLRAVSVLAFIGLTIDLAITSLPLAEPSLSLIRLLVKVSWLLYVSAIW